MKYAAFLRGINVGGHAIIKMEDLKKIFISSGFKDVSTYIQSGNVVFSSSEKKKEIIGSNIEQELKKYTGNDIVTFIRSVSQIDNIVKDNPFDETKLSKALMLYLAFLKEKPSNEIKKTLTTFNNDIETFVINNCEVYCLIRKDAGKTNFSPNWLEKKLKMPVTTRNWNTIRKIYSLMSENKI